MVVTQALATPEIGAVAWISGLFHVEQTNEDRINPAESADSASVENHVNNRTFTSKNNHSNFCLFSKDSLWRVPRGTIAIPLRSRIMDCLALLT